jgi:hypothetical protein
VSIPRSNSNWTLGLAIIALLASACTTPVGVTHLDEQAAHRELNANILSAGRPSQYSTQLLERNALSERFKRDPEFVLAELNSGLGKPDERDRLFALSELSFAHAEESGKAPYYLASAVYGYAFLFPANPADAPGPYDPRLRLAVDLYDSGIALGLATKDGKKLISAPGNWTCLLDRSVWRTTLKDSPTPEISSRNSCRSTISRFAASATRTAEPASALRPQLAFNQCRTVLRAAGYRRMRRCLSPPSCASIDPRRAMSDGRLHGTVELYDDDVTAAVQVGSYTVPLESDPSAALAYRLEGSPLWDFELAGFRRGDFSFLSKGNSADSSDLFMLHPYHPNLIPVVFVHGTASSPARWAEMENELLGDPAIASRYQLGFFIYNSGNPIPLSAMRLRESLVNVRKDVDPDGKDSALDQMVVIGHSQGGLLTKMTVVDSGTRFWNIITKVPFDKAALDPETRDLLARALFVKPLPFVTRVVFIATPQHGSYMASNYLVKFGNKLIKLPGGLAKSAVQLGKLRRPGPLGTSFTIPTALDNMDASNPGLKALAALPIAPGVHAHSIIPVKGTGPVEDGNDGVVEYKSAHIDGVESELVVRSGHSTQGTPETIEAVRRILYEHAGIP